ncbi:MAG: hypothetical protein OXC46_04710 [Thaumarchaeota archaeon]|nr:hypothetical protein [Nitrososphaerota archaeon]
MVSSAIESVVDTIGFNANWFIIDSYLNLWKKHFLEFLNKNTKTRGLLEAQHTDS